MLKKGIKQKLVFSLVLTISLLMIAFFILLDRYLKDYSISESEKTVVLLGKNTSSMLQRYLFNADYIKLSTTVQPIILNDFDYLVVFDNVTQNIAYKMDKNGVTEDVIWEDMLKIEHDREYVRSDLVLGHDSFTQFIFPVNELSVSKPLGFLIIGLSQKNMKSRLTGITVRIVIISVLLFLSLTLTIYLLADKIVRPIKQLSYSIGKFASGDYTVRSDINSKDEIGNLSYNFNFLADKLNEQIKKIERHSKDLEKNVEERTIELLKALDAIKEKDRKLTQAEKISSLNAIVSSIAHEINNPLAIISGNLQLLEVKVKDETFRKKLVTAQEAIDRIANLIDEINFFAAIKDVSTKPMSVSGVLREVTERLVPGGVSMVIQGEAQGKEGDMLDTNAHLLTICLENVLRNCVDMFEHKKLNGKLMIRYFKDNPYFVVEITDNAGGMEEPEKVFDPFYTTFSDKKGLGLTFVFHAIQALSGEVQVENVENPDTGEKGAKVSLMFPLQVEFDDMSEYYQWQQ